MAADFGPTEGNKEWCSGDLPHMDLGSPELFDKVDILKFPDNYFRIYISNSKNPN
ncbi:hypothetical protein M1146_05400 [Patescibacteria group bacterium]|nr:hypothetical protein [Patescibacteria group bacterium]